MGDGSSSWDGYECTPGQLAHCPDECANHWPNVTSIPHCDPALHDEATNSDTILHEEDNWGSGIAVICLLLCVIVLVFQADNDKKGKEKKEKGETKGKDKDKGPREIDMFGTDVEQPPVKENSDTEEEEEEEEEDPGGSVPNPLNRTGRFRKNKKLSKDNRQSSVDNVAAISEL